ncbi:hypothetical protein ACTA71_003008 [Dictyostelium dimigraforme]
MLPKILLLFILICFVNVCKSFYRITTSQFIVSDYSDYYNGPNDYYAVEASSIFSCRRTFFILVEPLTTDILPKQLINGNTYINGPNNSKVFEFISQANSNIITTYDIIIQDYNSNNYTIQQFLKIDCVEPPNSIITNVSNNQLYKYPFQSFYYTLVKLENMEKSVKPDFMGFIGQQYSNGISTFSNSQGFKNFLIFPFSILYTSTFSNNDIIVNTTFSGFSSKFNSYILKPYFTLSSSFYGNKESISVSKYPNNCTNLPFGQCVFLIDLKMTSRDYFLLSKTASFGYPQLVSGNELIGTYYFLIIPRLGSATTYSIGSFENGAYQASIVPDFVASYSDPPITPVVNINFTLQTQDGSQVPFGGQSAYPMAYGGDLYIGNKKEGIDIAYTKLPSCYPYLNGTKNKLSFSFSIPTSPYSRTVSPFSAIPYIFNNVFATFNIIGELTPKLKDTIPPVLEKFEIFENINSPNEIIIRMTVTDGGSGVRSIQISSSFGDQKYLIRGDPTYLVDGNVFNGVYQFSIPKYYSGSSISVIITDNAINSFSLQTYSVYNGIKRIDPLPIPIISPLDINNVYFENNDLDLSNSGVNNILYIQLKNTTIKNVSFSMVTLLNIEDKAPKSLSSNGYQLLDRKNYISKWNESLQLYQIQFSLPARLPTGVLSYYIDPIQNLNSATLFSMFGSDSELRVTSNDCDNMGPTVGSFQIIPSATVNIPEIPAQSTMIGFSFLVEDHLNGVNSVYITISSNLDIIGFDFKFENITGNPLSYLVNATFVIHSYDKPQTYTISKFKTIDGQGYIAEYPSILKVNPLLKFINSDPAITLSTNYAVSGIYISDDITPPTLSSWNVSKTTVQDLDNIIVFDFTIEDLGSGVSIANNPSVIVVCDNSLHIEGISQIMSTLQNPSNLYVYSSVTYRAKITLPFLFGYPNGISLGVYGIYDNHRNLNGYDSKKLSALNYQFFVNVAYGQNNSIITSLSYSDGFVIIEGLKFGINPRVKLIDDTLITYFKTFPYPYLNKTIIYLDVIDLRTSNLMNVRVSVTNNGQDYSNELTVSLPPIITPTPTITDTPPETPTPTSTPKPTSTPTPTPTQTQTPLPTNTPSPCKGSPLCGGNTQGKCTSLGCACILPYFGDDCSSKVIDIKPTVNETQPQVTMPYERNNTNVKVSSLVSVYSLREMDFNGEMKNEYLFNEWNYEALSTDEFKYSTEIINKNNGSSITTIVAIIKKFENTTDILFANEKITMLPSTIKYNINISNYQFIDSLHYLNLVMYTSISTSQTDDVCSTSSFGDSSSQLSSQYIKIQINDVSLYGEFIKRAIVDSRIVGVSNRQLNEDLSLNTGNNAHTFIAIEIPYYKDSIELDPNFSVLLESNSPNDNSICSANKSGLTKTQLVGIIIGCILFFMVIAIGVAYLIFRNSTSLRIKAISFKLKQFKK